MTDPDAAWRCEVCGQPYVVPCLARDCEERHEAETAPVTQQESA